MWDYYLALSEAGFATGLSQDLQLVLEKTRGSGRAAERLIASIVRHLGTVDLSDSADG